MKRGRPSSTQELRPPERALLDAIRSLGFGRIEFLRLRGGEPVLDPWPTLVRDVKFGVDRPEVRATAGADFELKGEVAELFEYTREVENGEIRMLVVRHGLPFTMEIELPGPAARQAGGDHA